MESVIVQLHFHQLWSLCDMWLKRYLTKYVKVQKICYLIYSLSLYNPLKITTYMVAVKALCFGSLADPLLGFAKSLHHA